MSISSSIHIAIDELRQAFEEFKKTNDQRLAELEKGVEDPLTEGKLDTLNAAMTRLQDMIHHQEMRQKRPVIAEQQTDITAPQKKAFLEYVRSGKINEFSMLEKKAFTNVGESGGYLLPDNFVTEIYSSTPAYSTMRSLATVVKTEHHQYEMIIAEELSMALWGEETLSAKNAEGTVTPKLKRINIPLHMLYYLPVISRTLLADTAFDLEKWFMTEMEKGMAQTENAAFFNGSGENQPKGILTYAKENAFQTLSTGILGGFAKENPDDILIQALYALKPQYVQNASWVMSRSALETVRKMKTHNGQYLWQPPMADIPQSLLGHPVCIDENMDALVKDKESLPIMVGDFAQAYTIADRGTVWCERDEFTHKPNVQIMMAKRVGGQVKDPSAVKIISCKK